VRAARCANTTTPLRTHFERLSALDAMCPQHHVQLAAFRDHLNPMALKRELDARLERHNNPLGEPSSALLVVFNFGFRHNNRRRSTRSGSLHGKSGGYPESRVT
jgi:hypothetical protein